LDDAPLGSQGTGVTAIRDKLGEVLAARERAELRVLVINDTNVVLTKNTKLGMAFGRFDTEPDVTIAPGDSDEFSVSGAVRVVGGVSYDLKGQEGTGWLNNFASEKEPGKEKFSSTIDNRRFIAQRPDFNENENLVTFRLTQRDAPSPKEFVSRVLVVNNTDVSLRKTPDGEIRAAGSFVKKPDDTIPPRTPMEFSIKSERTPIDNNHRISAALIWAPEGAPGETWTMSFERSSEDKDGRGQQDVKSPRFVADPIDATGKNFRFGLNGKGQPPQQGFVSRVVVRNNTDVTLQRFGDVLLGAGTLVTGPPDAIAPQDAEVLRVQSQKDPNSGADVVAVTAIWSTGGGNWTVAFNHASNQKEGRADQLLGDNRFVREEPKVNGKDVEFILSKNSAPPSAQQFVSRVTVVNNTDTALTQKEVVPAAGAFVKPPPSKIAPGKSEDFRVRSETNPNDGTDTVAGAVVWEPDGFPRGERWTISYERTSNDANGRPQQDLKSIRFTAEDPPQSQGTDFVFTLNPAPEPKFERPIETKQPTLRLTDESADGWVEYLKERLNRRLNPSPNLPLSGTFDQATHNAVITYQTQEELLVDGVVGNQTWASLRLDDPEAPSTDGRTPHEFVEGGLEARWFSEGDVAVYTTSTDTMELAVVSVGDNVDLEGQPVKVFITPPNSPRKGVVAKIGPVILRTQTSQGNVHQVLFADFAKTFPSTPPANPPGSNIKGYVIEGFFDAEFGGDFWTSTRAGITVKP
jgi:peptidoglycan hydrolase-like protein with peptidoglycan-binding domain